MIQQNRTIWFVRNYNENDDSDYEIQLLNSSVVEPTVSLDAKEKERE